MSAPGTGTITYYRDRAVRVTTAAVHVDEQVYPLDQLTRVWHRRDRQPWRELAGRGFWGITYLLPLAGAAAGIAIAVALDLSFGSRVLIVAGSILVGFSAGPLLDPFLGKLDDSYDRGLHRYEIWVERNGAELMILQTRNAARFGRIYRALQRAAESG